MFGATRRWFNRNRTPLAIGVGVVGAGYFATQYVFSRIKDARERMSSEKIAKAKYASPVPHPPSRPRLPPPSCNPP
ncbi:hypothetical protein IMZ48_08365 [Candidatus Bathyarchaeota archaeon]|nr:hypothetical protein [Candidatus Bathyarchaeota archaeon]